MIAQKRSTAEPNQKADLNRRWPQTGESENVTFPPQMGAVCDTIQNTPKIA